MNDEDQIKLLYPPFAESVQDFLQKTRKEGLIGGIYSGLRTYDDQDELYAHGRSSKGPLVTCAKAGQSFHCFGLAIDYVFKDKHGNWTWQGPYSVVGEIAKECKLEWGGNFLAVDKPHVQNSYKEDARKLDYIYRHSIVSGAPLHAVWKYLNEEVAKHA